MGSDNVAALFHELQHLTLPLFAVTLGVFFPIYGIMHPASVEDTLQITHSYRPYFEGINLKLHCLQKPNSCLFIHTSSAGLKARGRRVTEVQNLRKGVHFSGVVLDGASAKDSGDSCACSLCKTLRFCLS